MPRTDYSRLGELFYASPKEDRYGISMKGFIQGAFKEFLARNLDVLPDRRAVFSYPGKDSSISLSVFYKYGHPEVRKLEMNGRLSTFVNALSLLRGYVRARFSYDSTGKTSRILESANIKIDKPYIQFGDVMLNFSRAEKDYVLREINLQKERRILKKRKALRIEEAHLDELSFNLLANASELHANNPHFLENKSNGLLINEDILLRRTNSYGAFVYTLSCANDSPIPSMLIDRFESFFALIKNDFDLTSFKRLKTNSEEAGVC